MSTQVTEHAEAVDGRAVIPAMPVASTGVTLPGVVTPSSPLVRVATTDSTGVLIGPSGRQALILPNRPEFLAVRPGLPYDLVAGPITGGGGDPLAGFDWFASSLALPASMPWVRTGAGAQELYGATWATALYATKAANLPRFNRLADEKVGLIVERGTTNLCLRSSAFGDGTAWTKSGIVINDNVASPPVPAGTPAERMVPSATNGAAKRTAQTIAVTSGLPYSAGWIAKLEAAACRYMQLTLGGSGGNAFGLNAWANFDLQAGVIGSVGSAATARMIPQPNGWWRCVVSAVATATQTAEAMAVMQAMSLTDTRWPLCSGFNAVDGSLAWQASFEQHSHQTSFLDTAAAAVSRGPDIGVRAVTVPSTAAGFSYRVIASAPYGKPPAGAVQMLHELSDNTTGNHYQVSRVTNGDLFFDIRVAGNILMTATLGPIADGERFTVVVSVINGSVAVGLKGVVATRQAPVSLPPITHEQWGGGIAAGNEWCGHILAAPASPTVWGPALNDAQLAIASAVTV